ncbi:hypothetical protein VNI00_017283 [Paramarasmius palmivorus]|uniref:Uncharacterized protein n=1 Tax=Paramarasmius palmivorus TaxID=297713 RepID=A0AAW0B6Q8_9AGAR
MNVLVLRWLRRWGPMQWTRWGITMKKYWKRRVTELIIRYFDWKLGTHRGLEKLSRNRSPVTPPSSPVGLRSIHVLSQPAFVPISPSSEILLSPLLPSPVRPLRAISVGPSSPIKSTINKRRKRFQLLFDN